MLNLSLVIIRLLFNIIWSNYGLPCIWSLRVGLRAGLSQKRLLTKPPMKWSNVIKWVDLSNTKYWNTKYWSLGQVFPKDSYILLSNWLFCVCKNKTDENRQLSFPFFKICKKHNYFLMEFYLKFEFVRKVAFWKIVIYIFQ